VPRPNPQDTEQLVRAQRLRDLGLVDLLCPEELSPAALARWLARELEPPRVHAQLDFNGLARLPRLLEQMLAGPSPREAGQPNVGGLCGVSP